MNRFFMKRIVRSRTSGPKLRLGASVRVQSAVAVRPDNQENVMIRRLGYPRLSVGCSEERGQTSANNAGVNYWASTCSTTTAQIAG